MLSDEDILLQVYYQQNIERLNNKLLNTLGSPSGDILDKVESILGTFTGGQALYGSLNPNTVFGRMDLQSLLIMFGIFADLL